MDYIYSILTVSVSGTLQFKIDKSLLPQGEPNGLCGVLSLAAAARAMGSTLSAEDIIRQMSTTPGIDYNYPSAEQIARMATELGLDAYYKNGEHQISLSGSSRERLNALKHMMSLGWYPIVRVWTDSGGNLVKNTGQTILYGDKYPVGHWVWIIRIFEMDGVTWVEFYNPALGVQRMQWQEFYENISISWQTQPILDTRTKKYIQSIYNNTAIIYVKPPISPPDPLDPYSRKNTDLP